MKKEEELAKVFMSQLLRELDIVKLDKASDDEVVAAGRMVARLAIKLAQGANYEMYKQQRALD